MIHGDVALLEGRKFQLWDYWVSHAQLLIRSPYQDERPNVDLKFMSVSFIDIPSIFSEIKIEKATGEEKETLQIRLGRDYWRGDNVYVLLCEGQRHFVIAAGLIVEENWHTHMKSSLVYPWNWQEKIPTAPWWRCDHEDLAIANYEMRALREDLEKLIVSEGSRRPKEGLGAVEIASLWDDCSRLLLRHLSGASKETALGAFGLLDNLLKELLRPNRREKALLERSSLLVWVQYELEQEEAD